MTPEALDMSPSVLQVFINYRRDDTADAAGRLYDALTEEFGDRVFMDIDTIEPGVDFVDVVHQAVGSCDVLLALIGNRWAGVPDDKGRRRLDDPNDFVRLEIQAALDRNVRVIPVLLQGAEMPGSEELPEPLSRLVRRNAMEISSSRWHYDVGRLIETLRKLADEKAATSPPALEKVIETPVEPPREAKRPPSTANGRHRSWVLPGVIGGLVLAVAAVILLSKGGGAHPAASRSGSASSQGSALPPPRNSVVEIDPASGAILATVPTPADSDFVGQDIAVGQGSIWVRGTLGVARIDINEQAPPELIAVNGASDVGVGHAGVWVTHEDRVSRIVLANNTLANAIRPGAAPSRVAVGKYVWVLTSGPTSGDQDDELVRLNGDGSVSGSIHMVGSDLIVPDSGVWVVDTANSEVVRVDPENVVVLDTVPVPQPDGIAPSADGLWMFNTDAGTLTEVRLTSGGAAEVQPSISLDVHPIDLTVARDAIWTANQDGSISKIVDGKVVNTFDLGSPVVALRVEVTMGRLFALIG